SQAELHNEVMTSERVKKEEDVFTQVCQHSLMMAALQYDEQDFEQAWRSAVRRLGIRRTMTEVIYPLLKHVGLLWMTEKMNPAQEHFLSCLIRKKLLVAIDSLPAASWSKKTWLLFLHNNEDHEIPLLLAHYLLKSAGYRVAYLGSRVPFQNILQ